MPAKKDVDPTTMQYTQPKARRVRRLSTNPEFCDENGKPDIQRLALTCGLHVNVTKHILEEARKAAPRDEEVLK